MCPVALQDKPAAYLVPKLVDLKNAVRHNVPPHAVELIDGTVMYTPEFLFDGIRHPVEDKHGVKYYPIPLYEKLTVSDPVSGD